ncbi:MAG: exodeoxyribonuclease VII small subunit [Anaerolineae bacterium]|nr:exodeoxyribonuclease VII small subunit [Anaerolineae bacterium]
MNTEEIARMSFEEAFHALEEAVAQLEEGDLPLEEALRVFERGMALVRHCNQHLDQAELRVRELQREGPPSQQPPPSAPPPADDQGTLPF